MSPSMYSRLVPHKKSGSHCFSLHIPHISTCKIYLHVYRHVAQAVPGLIFTQPRLSHIAKLGPCCLFQCSPGYPAPHTHTPHSPGCHNPSGTDPALPHSPGRVLRGHPTCLRGVTQQGRAAPGPGLRARDCEGQSAGGGGPGVPGLGRGQA